MIILIMTKAMCFAFWKPISRRQNSSDWKPMVRTSRESCESEPGLLRPPFPPHARCSHLELQSLAQGLLSGHNTG